MVNEWEKSPGNVVRMRFFGQESEIINGNPKSLGETCARPWFVLKTLRQLRDSALNVIESHWWLEVTEVPTGLEHQVDLQAGYSYGWALPSNAISINPFLPKKTAPNPPETDWLPS